MHLVSNVVMMTAPRSITFGRVAVISYRTVTTPTATKSFTKRATAAVGTGP